MPIFRGTNNISKIYRGTNEIVKVFRGVDLIFQSGEPEYELIADLNVTTATTQIDFDNLNITKDDELRLVWTLTGDSSTYTFHSIRANNFTSGYSRQELGAGGSSIFAGRFTNGIFNLSNTVNRSSGFMDMKISNNDRFVAKSQFVLSLASNSNDITIYNINVVNTNAISTINNLSVISSRTNGIGVGSRLQLYKVNTGVA